MWQSLYDELKDHAFTVLAVALDHADAARPWIEAAKPAYPCLIDRDHHLADLYNLVNVPQAVWIDEDGRIVRPPETAGSTDGFRAMDRKTFAMPDAAIAERNRVKTLYIGAVRDWVLRGTSSVNALDEAGARTRLKVPDATDRRGARALSPGAASVAARPARRGAGAAGASHRPAPRLVGHVAADGGQGRARPGGRPRVLGASRCVGRHGPTTRRPTSPSRADAPAVAPRRQPRALRRASPGVQP